MTLHILGGEWKGRILTSPKTKTTRPTQGVVRQAVFNICQWQISDAHFLDLFAGSGAMGLEALSRGAKDATFVEEDASALHCIRENIKKLGVQEKTTILTTDIFQSMRFLAKQGRAFDLIYIDPPYAAGPQIITLILQELEKNSLLKESATIFVEESSLEPETSYESSLLKKKNSRRYGLARLTQYELATY